MKIRYYPNTDMLNIDLSAASASGGGEEVAEGIVLLYDDTDRLVGIEIEDASKRVDLTDIASKPSNIIDDSGKPVEIYTVTELAKKWNLTSRTIQKTIRAMAEAGIRIGMQQGPNHPIILDEIDVQQIQKWRQEHPPGRPKHHSSQLLQHL